MNLQGQETLIIGYASDEETGLTRLTLSAPGDVSLGEILIETSKAKSFYTQLSEIFSEKARLEGQTLGMENRGKLLHRVNQKTAEIEYQP